jgi:hypothetical protein
MTPTAVEQKAKELFDKYFLLSESATDKNLGWVISALNKGLAKRCALITVDEIITALDEHQWQNRNVIEFYFSVKKEIEKL